MRSVSRTTLLRWLVPVLAAVAVIGGGAAYGLISASARPGLPARTAAQLLTDVATARVDGLSGTVALHADLGVPALGGGAESSDLASLLSGDHTLKVWMAPPDRARVALLGTLGESDVVLDGHDLWTWSSSDRTATHRTVVLPDHTAPGSSPDAVPGTVPDEAGLPLTPQAAARMLLRAVGPTTRVTTSGTAVVAGRSAYEMVLEPRTPGSLVGQVRIAVDAQTHLPLRVQVIPVGSSRPAFEVAFTQLSVGRPPADQLSFTPPPGAKVVQKPPLRPGAEHRPERSPERSPDSSSGPWSGPAPQLFGRGWDTVVVTRLPSAGASATSRLPGTLSQALRALPHVSGPWGSGRLLQGTLFSAVLSDDGRVAVGPVTPARLYDALAAR